MKENEMPSDLVDQNIRIDYTKLRHLMLTDRKLNGNFGELRKIIETSRRFPRIFFTDHGSNFECELYSKTRASRGDCITRSISFSSHS